MKELEQYGIGMSSSFHRYPGVDNPLPLKQCNNCTFWARRFDRGPENTVVGECRKNTPVVGEKMRVFPVTYDDDFCGNHLYRYDALKVALDAYKAGKESLQKEGSVK
jgi:hypothetical protein